MSKVLIVTGASKHPGIGSAVSMLAVSHDWNVIVNGRSEPTWTGDRAIFVPGDICKESTQQAIVDTAINHWGRIDGIVHNAALTHSAKAIDFALDWKS